MAKKGGKLPGVEVGPLGPEKSFEKVACALAVNSCLSLSKYIGVFWNTSIANPIAFPWHFVKSSNLVFTFLGSYFQLSDFQ